MVQASPKIKRHSDHLGIKSLPSIIYAGVGYITGFWKLTCLPVLYILQQSRLIMVLSYQGKKTMLNMHCSQRQGKYEVDFKRLKQNIYHASEELRLVRYAILVTTIIFTSTEPSKNLDTLTRIYIITHQGQPQKSEWVCLLQSWLPR